MRGNLLDATSIRPVFVAFFGGGVSSATSFGWSYKKTIRTTWNIFFLTFLTKMSWSSRNMFVKGWCHLPLDISPSLSIRGFPRNQSIVDSLELSFCRCGLITQRERIISRIHFNDLLSETAKWIYWNNTFFFKFHQNQLPRICVASVGYHYIC